MKIPQHIVLFPDGNGRWAKQNGLPAYSGYQKGYENIFNFTAWCRNRGVKVLTIFGFSTENWNRSPAIVSLLMKLLESKLLANIEKYMKSEELKKMGVRVKIMGQKERLTKSLRAAIEKAEELTKNNKDILVNLAISYGGKWDILSAVKRIVESGISAKEIDEKLFESYLSTAGLPPIDFMIRAGGEIRLSNSALWQLAYSELYFSPKLWPDFTEQDLDLAIVELNKRSRRLGK